MITLMFITAGGVGERFPDARFIFLEANGGWIVPWLERLDHKARADPVGSTLVARRGPSTYFRRQCWISFDPDENPAGRNGAIESVWRRPDSMGI